MTTRSSPATRERWRDAGASHLSLITMHAGLETTDAHIGALEEMAPVLLS